MKTSHQTEMLEIYGNCAVLASLVLDVDELYKELCPVCDGGAANKGVCSCPKI